MGNTDYRGHHERLKMKVDKDWKANETKAFSLSLGAVDDGE